MRVRQNRETGGASQLQTSYQQWYWPARWFRMVNVASLQNVRTETKVTTIRRGRYLVEVPIEVIYSPDAPDDPIIDPETARLLDDIAKHAAAGDVPWLKQYGKVYELIEAD